MRRFLASTELYCIEASRNSSFTFCNVVVINIYLQDNEYSVNDDRKANPHAKPQQWCIQPEPEIFFCSSCWATNRHLTFRKAGSFFHSTRQLNYLSPLVSNALYGSILLFVLSSFKFLSKLSASRDAKIPNKLLMPYNCTLLSFHSSPWYSKPAFSFCNM